MDKSRKSKLGCEGSQESVGKLELANKLPPDCLGCGVSFMSVYSCAMSYFS